MHTEPSLLTFETLFFDFYREYNQSYRLVTQRNDRARSSFQGIALSLIVS